jgi:Zn-finger nucleic acid-binding protein
MKGSKMNCPVCKVELKIADRQGVEIDYCSQCRGVWLDRGELDKIIERSGTGAEGPAHEPQERYRDDEYRQANYRRKKKSFLGEMFDFE